MLFCHWSSFYHCSTDQRGCLCFSTLCSTTSRDPTCRARCSPSSSLVTRSSRATSFSSCSAPSRSQPLSSLSAISTSTSRWTRLWAFDSDGHKQWPWQSQTCFLKDGMAVNSLWIWRFLKSMPLVFHIFIAVAVMVYIAAVMVCGRHGIPCGRHGLWPSWYRPVLCNDHTVFDIMNC